MAKTEFEQREATRRFVEKLVTDLAQTGGPATGDYQNLDVHGKKTESVFVQAERKSAAYSIIVKASV